MWVGWRLVKLLAVAWFAGGLFTSVTRPDRAGRLRALRWLTTPGFLAAWIAGYGLTQTLHHKLSETWLLGGITSSVVALHGAALGARADRPRVRHAALAIGGLLSTIAVMVVMPKSVAALAGLSALTGALALLAVPSVVPATATHDADDDVTTWGWFRDIAWLEGASLALMVCVSMPLKYGAGFAIDGGTGLLGWTHGALVVVYLQALSTTARALGWSRRRAALGFLSSLLPFGTFVFVHRVRAEAPTSERPRAAA
jgi:integral membrane protein